MATNTPEAKGRKGAVIITLIIVALLAGGIFWYMQTNNGTQDSTYNTEKLAENLKGIDAQDKKYANVTSIHLTPSGDVEKQYQVLRPLEQITAENAQNDQPSSNTLTAKEAYAIGKNNDDGKTQYNAAFFTYELTGEMLQQSTDKIFKSQLDNAIEQNKQSQQQNGTTVSINTPEKLPNIKLKTTNGESLELATSKFEQVISNGEQQKKILVIGAAAKFGSQLLFITATYGDESVFADAPQKLQDMADLITLQLSE